MAGTAANDAQVIALELERVTPKIRTLFDRDKRFISRIMKKNVEKVSNRLMRVPLEINPGGSFQYFNADGGDLGRGSAQIYDKATLQPVFMSENIEYTKLAQWATDSDRKSIVSAVREFTAKAYDELMRQLDAQLMQSGNGALATITSVSTSGGVDTYTCTTDGFGVRLVRDQQQIQVYDSTLATLRGSGYITQWDVENKQIQVTPAIAGATGTDRVVVYGIANPTSLPALFGVPYHDSNASTGTWLGFNRATTPQIRASRVNGNAAAFTLPLARLAINKIGNRVGQDNNFNPEAWMHPAQKQQYESIGQLVSVIYKEAKEEGLNMYFDKMQMAGANVQTSFNWDQTRIDFITDNLWGRGEILPLGFYTTDGRKTFELRGPSGGVLTADIFYLVIGTQTFVSNPAAISYIDNLAVPSGY
jgi:hypothetical protein